MLSVMNELPVEFDFHPEYSTWHTIRHLLDKARGSGIDGPVAEYLVGAKLQLRFPDIEVRNSKYSTADEQTGEAGDFQIDQTVFHVSVHPTDNHYLKCTRNIDDGLRVFFLVPEEYVTAARTSLERIVPNRVAVQSIEAFVSQNIEEIATFRPNDLKDSLTTLIHLYNDRVQVVEPDDKAKLIRVPSNLGGEPDDEPVGEPEED